MTLGGHDQPFALCYSLPDKSAARYNSKILKSLGDSFMTRITRAICVTGALLSLTALPRFVFS